MGGARYTASGNTALATTADTAFQIAGITATFRRAWIEEFTIGDKGTPADNVVNYIVQRSTAIGTEGAAVVPARKDLADAESDMDCGEDYSTEPTYTATEELWELPLNTRATYRWVAPPDGELVVPATNAAGIGWFGAHASATTNYRVTVGWVE